MELLPKATEALWYLPLHFSGRRKSNHFLNGSTDAEERLVSAPRGCRDPQRTSGPAKKESGSYHAMETSPGLQPEGPSQGGHRHTDPWCGGAQSAEGLEER